MMDDQMCNINNSNSSCNNSNSLCKNKLLYKIMTVNFAINDLVLFLDTHPNNKCALDKHNEYVCELKELMNEYQEKYGPLTVNFSDKYWSWEKTPWPWERRD